MTLVREGVLKLNKLKLEETMASKSISKSEMCAKLGISRSAFYRKLNCQTDFTLKEITSIMKILNLKTPNGIFFDQ